MSALLLIHLGIEHIEGDMFKSVPKGDAIILKVRTSISYHTYILASFEKLSLKKY